MTKFLKLGAAALLIAGMSHQALAGPAVPTGIADQTSTTHVTPVQFTLQFGASDRKIRRNLRNQGYTEIEITGRQLARATAEACKAGIRYRIQIRSSGRIRRQQEIGQCKRIISIDDAEKMLEEEGYRRIVIEENGDIPYIAIACLKNDKIRLRINKFGEVTGRRNLGECVKTLQPDDIRVKLREDGYNRIKFTDRQLPRYVAEACRNNRRIRLVINRRGVIRDRERIGRCEPPLRARDLKANLSERGLDRIEVINNRPPRYVVEACRDLKRVEVTVGRFGKILREYRIGRCQAPLTRADLLVEMRKNNYRRIKFNTIPGANYETEACRERKRYKTRWTQYGEVIKEDDLGRCVSPRLQEITDRFSDRGLKNLKVIIEGCRRGRKIQITIDEFSGDRIERERVGRC